MQKTFLLLATFFAATAVVSGAFGAHGLKDKISAEYLQVFETGVRYQFYHSLALLLLALFAGKINPSYFNSSGSLFIAGIILFSGSLYLLSTRELLGVESWKKMLGPLTPLGGLCFIAGWLSLFLGIYKSDSL